MSFKIGLALGGGGVRGFAHLGAMRVLKEEGIEFDLISGTSFGSIVGATYSIDGSVSNCQNRMLSALDARSIRELELLLESTSVEKKSFTVEKFADFVKDLCLWNLKALRPWLFDSHSLEDLIYKLVGDRKFSDLKVPFVSLAADLYTGEKVEIHEGEILPAVMASISLAGIFPPYKLNNKTLIDGGALSIVPVDSARSFGADFVIGINVEGNLLFKSIHNGLDALFQAYEISSYELNRIKLENCDFVVTPQVQEVKWAQFSKARDCIRAGEKEARRILPGLKDKINQAKAKRKIFSFLKINNK